MLPLLMLAICAAADATRHTLIRFRCLYAICRAMLPVCHADADIAAAIR